MGRSARIRGEVEGCMGRVGQGWAGRKTMQTTKENPYIFSAAKLGLGLIGVSTGGIVPRSVGKGIGSIVIIKRGKYLLCLLFLLCVLGPGGNRHAVDVRRVR